MKVKDRKALGEYIRWCGVELGLRDWWFELAHDPIDDSETALADVKPTAGKKSALIRVCHEFRDLRPDQQRNAVLHELLHCHHAAATDVIRLDLPEHLPQAVYDVIWGGFARQIEYMVDGIATAISERFPLIDWPD